jgi:enamidase
MSDDDLDKVIDTTSFAVEICSSGNYGSTKRAVERMRAKGQLARLTLGTDTPGGTGVIPRGMFRNICYIASVCGVPPRRRSPSPPATPRKPTVSTLVSWRRAGRRT